MSDHPKTKDETAQTLERMKRRKFSVFSLLWGDLICYPNETGTRVWIMLTGRIPAPWDKDSKSRKSWKDKLRKFLTEAGPGEALRGNQFAIVRECPNPSLW